MASTSHLHIAASVPPTLTPADIIAALHDHSTCLALLALTPQHEAQPSADPAILKDTYWYPVDLHPVSSYAVRECIVFLPGVGEWGKRHISFPAHFQNTPHGIKSRADGAGGVVVRAEFRVIRGGSLEGEVEGEGEGIGDAEWVLVEDVEVTCKWWMMPFVRARTDEAHRWICRKVVESAVMGKQQEGMREVEEERLRAREREMERRREEEAERERKERDSSYKIEMPQGGDDDGDDEDGDERVASPKAEESRETREVVQEGKHATEKVNELTMATKEPVDSKVSTDEESKTKDEEHKTDSPQERIS